ncbi:MAG: hypothetical protein ACJAQT_000960 [Akkermansiaceae bacterium]|jgi:hypothetical protein
MKRQLSSSTPYFYKKVFPAIWFGALSLFLVGAIAGSIQGGTFHTSIIVFLTVMLGFGYLIMKILVFDLMDQVTEDGNALIVRNKDSEERILLLNIINVNDNSFVNPPRITPNHADSSKL